MNDQPDLTPDVDTAPPPPAPPKSKPAVAKSAPVVAMTDDQVIDALQHQLDTLDLPNMDSEAAKKWLSDFRVPLASVPVSVLGHAMQVLEQDRTEAELEMLYDALTPAELNAVLAANAETFGKIANSRVKEAVLLRMTGDTLSNIAASYLMQAMLRAIPLAV